MHALSYRPIYTNTHLENTYPAAITSAVRASQVKVKAIEVKGGGERRLSAQGRYINSIRVILPLTNVYKSTLQSAFWVWWVRDKQRMWERQILENCRI